MITAPKIGKPVPETKSRPWKGLRVLGIGVLAAAALGAALAGSTLPRWRQPQIDGDGGPAALPRVTVVVAQRMAANAERVLPGNSLPLLEASMYARTTGYLKSRLVDIGDRVKEGQLLAEISAPDIDDQLAQAQANLAQAKANLVKGKADLDYALSERDRYRQMLRFNATSEEEYQSKLRGYDVARAAIVALEAAIHVYEATVQRYTDLQSFQKITAPFPGVITARNVDPGDLISADAPSTTRELFHLMRTDVLRVFVNVPQVFAPEIKLGQAAAVYVRDDPSRQFPGKVTRTADALDPNTRTLLTEVDVPNPDNALRPGMYLQVKFVFDRGVAPIMIPAAALATRAGPAQVAVLDDQHRVQYRTVQLGRDFGAEIQVRAGLKEGEQVVVHPGDDLPEGTVVDPVPQPTNKPGS
jgi:RND family efflux transporter MFP subunit